VKTGNTFEFDGLSRDVQNFLMEILFAYVFEFRLAQNQRDSGLRHLFFLDEEDVIELLSHRDDRASRIISAFVVGSRWWPIEATAQPDDGVSKLSFDGTNAVDALVVAV